MPTVDREIHRFRQFLAQQGLKLTSERTALVREIFASHYHYEHVTGNSHHDHLICTTCGSVIEFHDPTLEQRQRDICEKKRFTPTFHNLQILGVCDSCRKKGALPDAPDRVKMIDESALQLRK